MSSEPRREVTLGEQLPPVVRETGFANWNRYAAVNDEFVPIHMDDEAGRAAGYPAAFGMGNLQWAYLHIIVRGWMPAGSRLLSMKCQFRGANVKGQTVTARGEVIAIDDAADGRRATVKVWTEDQTGTPLAPGEAVVLLPG
ncbi:MaoC/PaaZ C-terminal domain-containing protein [Pseudonocardia oroxyli]|uniref:Acyl dehydratase n=1 Tax=Pseudonocardia oroxyli TaxID=366584 RepID=A0A1G8EL81_PSEOR|nr:MaoC/PaaZ C-terminal domain-containing protein [Pseudonocardia oroxyli]SDH70611.1 Acyl dehydratase [Pseudonocardia oroxyli]